MEDFDPPIPHAERLDSGLLSREASLLRAMAEHYCKKVHGSPTLCEECKQHLRYSLARLACCPYGNEKPACSKCQLQCHKAQEKDHIRQVMRTSAPPMLIYHPVLTIEHLLRSLKKAPPHPRDLRQKHVKK